MKRGGFLSKNAAFFLVYLDRARDPRNFGNLSLFTTYFFMFEFLWFSLKLSCEMVFFFNGILMSRKKCLGEMIDFSNCLGTI